MNACQLSLGRQILELRPWYAANTPSHGPGDEPEWTWQRLASHDFEEMHRIVTAFARQGDAMGRLRGLVAADDSSTPSMLDDMQLLSAVAGLLADRRLVLFERVLTDEARKRYGRPRSVQQPPQPLAVSPSRLRQSQQEAPPPSAPIPEEPAPFDNDAQAASLMRAAEEGAPFCEICEQARLADLAEDLAAWVPDEPPPSEQDAQAAALVMAAAQGVPFCEMCERAKRDAAANDSRQAA